MDSRVKIRGFRGAGVCPNHFCSTTFKMVLVALEEVQRGRSGASPRVGSFCAVYNPDCTLLSSSFPVQLTLLLSSPLLQAHFLSLSPALLCSLKNFNSLFSPVYPCDNQPLPPSLSGLYVVFRAISFWFYR